MWGTIDMRNCIEFVATDCAEMHTTMVPTHDHRVTTHPTICHHCKHFSVILLCQHSTSCRTCLTRYYTHLLSCTVYSQPRALSSSLDLTIHWYNSSCLDLKTFSCKTSAAKRTMPFYDLPACSPISSPTTNKKLTLPRLLLLFLFAGAVTLLIQFLPPPNAFWGPSRLLSLSIIPLLHLCSHLVLIFRQAEAASALALGIYASANRKHLSSPGKWRIMVLGQLAYLQAPPAALVLFFLANPCKCFKSTAQLPGACTLGDCHDNVARVSRDTILSPFSYSIESAQSSLDLTIHSYNQLCLDLNTLSTRLPYSPFSAHARENSVGLGGSFCDVEENRFLGGVRRLISAGLRSTAEVNQHSPLPIHMSMSGYKNYKILEIKWKVLKISYAEVYSPLAEPFPQTPRLSLL
ncbi:uncharacterized protein BDR25DRAFT_363320 [Lindgomyces ingoldianus]|uniref:Uncharacterized protein n=1 Tax=Lindgomyces ingoldianus TaxID=673940 RepID=A0ACB6Q7R8_9PLEO|nr:uncharacterized protein BDR25DRAFT_363320 [Lindgomyces ingoldianus]KAF2462918.1 hypothetical protein BDR25DRAFT_363320 [Lindgomyces ingoldianus]